MLHFNLLERWGEVKNSKIKWNLRIIFHCVQDYKFMSIHFHRPHICKAATALNFVVLKTWYFKVGKFLKVLHLIHILIFSVILLWYLLNILVSPWFARHFVGISLWWLFKIRYAKCYTEETGKGTRLIVTRVGFSQVNYENSSYLEFSTGPLTVPIFTMQESHSERLLIHIYLT